MKSMIYFVMGVLLHGSTGLCSEVQAQQWQWLGPDSVEVDYVYAKGDTICMGTPESLYRSVNRGITWRVVDSSLGTGQIVSLGIDPKSSRTVYVAKRAGRYYTGGLLYESLDAGTTWQLLSDTLTHRLEAVRYVGVSPHNSGVVFATNRTGFAGQLNDLYRSTDEGKTWTFVGGDFAYSSHGVQIEIAFDPVDSMKMYATGYDSFDNQFYVSTNGGVNWSTRSYLQIAPATIIVDWSHTSRIYVFATPFRSDNAGYTWARSDSGMPSGWWYWSSTIDPHNSSTLYMSTTLGVYRTTNYGNFWEKLEGSEFLRIDSRGFSVDPVMRTLYVGTGHGLYSYNLVTSVEQTDKPPSILQLYQNYPNPFNPSTVISYQLPIGGHVTLKVYNLLGQEVATLVDGVQEAGFNSVTFDATRLPSGVYFYRLVAGSFIQNKRMLLVK